MPNIEIKAKCADLKKARITAEKYKTDYLGVLHQVDTYFATKSGRLKLREINGESAQLIPYSKDYNAGPMRSDYALLPVEDPLRVKEIFHRLLGTEFVVDKMREVFLIQNVRVHLDDVIGLGTFVEFEAVCTGSSKEELLRQNQMIQELMVTFEIKTTDLMDSSYVDYLAPKTRRGVQVHSDISTEATL